MIPDIATVLKAKRKECKLSVKDVLQMLKSYGIEISDKTLYGWERGHRQPDSDTFLVLCHIYGIDSISEILGLEKNQELLKADEQRLLSNYRSLNEQGQELIRQQMELLVESRRYKKSCDIPNLAKEA